MSRPPPSPGSVHMPRPQGAPPVGPSRHPVQTAAPVALQGADCWLAGSPPPAVSSPGPGASSAELTPGPQCPRPGLVHRRLHKRVGHTQQGVLPSNLSFGCVALLAPGDEDKGSDHPPGSLGAASVTPPLRPGALGWRLALATALLSHMCPGLTASEDTANTRTPKSTLEIRGK